jgi:hypothetical protein
MHFVGADDDYPQANSPGGLRGWHQAHERVPGGDIVLVPDCPDAEAFRKLREFGDFGGRAVWLQNDVDFQITPLYKVEAIPQSATRVTPVFSLT